jgi:hypothetical protein
MRTITYSLRMDRNWKWSGCDLTGSLRTTITYLLKIDREGNGPVDLTESLRTITYNLRMDRDLEMVNRVIENHHIHTGDGHILGNGQVNFTTLVKPMTYRLRTDRD